MAPKITASYATSLIYKPVFDIWFSDERYQHWKNNDDAQWQLRCVGGPGSGKTHFSLLVIQDLYKKYRGKNTAIVSIFLGGGSDTSESRNVSFTTDFLAEVARQLEGVHHESREEGIVSCENSCEEKKLKTKTECDNDEAMRRKIMSARSSFERAFIIIDDLDIVRESPEDYYRLENEFVNLQASKFKIFTTSRVAFKPDPLVGYCDVHGPEDKLVDGSDDPVKIWWECPICVDAEEAEYYICDGCFLEGYRCKDNQHKDTPLVQRRDRVNLDNGSPPLSDFVKYFLECAHGDLGFESQARLLPEERCTLPPLSPLGRALKIPANEAAKEERVKALIDETGDNIAIALMQLENISLARTVDVVGAQSDRLPRNIVASFDAGIDRIMQRRDKLRRDLGLKAIRIVGKSGHMAGIPFSDLRDSIVREWNPSDQLRIRELLDSENAVEEVLSASNGLLEVRFNPGDEEPYIECFHKDFDLYVSEDYGNSLVGYSLHSAEESEN